MGYLDDEFGYAATGPPPTDVRSRERMAEQGVAMSDGSFPIRNCRDVERAVRAMNRNTNKTTTGIRRHIIRRARTLGCNSHLPSTWEQSTRDSSVRVTRL